MTDIILYPMALYPPKGEMLIVENEQEHLEALAAWEAAAEAEKSEVAEDEPAKRGPGRPRLNP